MRFLVLIGMALGLTAAGQGLFDTGVLHEVRIDRVTPALWDSLAMDQEAFLDGAPARYHAVDVTVDGHALPSTGMRFKGDYSYWGFPGKKRPIKLDFDRFVEGQEHAGQTKVNLHNFAGDPSFLREMLAYGLLREQGLPASRTAYARVYVNDTLLGLYLLVEDVGKRFCKGRFGSAGTLYQCIDDTELAWQGPDTAAYTDEFKIEHDAGDAGWGPLLALMELIDADHSAVFRQRLDALLDVDGYLRALTIDVLLNNWDSYHDNGRNFELYRSPNDGRLHWIPWDYNLCLWERDLELPPRDGSADGYKPLVARIADDPLLQEDLWRTACEVLDRVDLQAVRRRLVDYRALIASAVQADPNKFYTDADFQRNMDQGVVVTMLRGGVPTPVPLPGVYDRLVRRLSTLRLGVARHADCADPAITDLVLQVYPNPSTGAVTVRWDLRDSPVAATLEVVDPLGRVVLQRTYDPRTERYAEVLDFAPGRYLVRLSAGREQAQRTVLVF